MKTSSKEEFEALISSRPQLSKRLGLNKNTIEYLNEQGKVIARARYYLVLTTEYQIEASNTKGE